MRQSTAGTRRSTLRRSLVPVLLLASSAAVAAPTFELPPLVVPAATEQHPGKVIWTDLVTPDLSGAKQFYGGLFGWTFHDVHAGTVDYSIALLDGEAVAGIVRRALPSRVQRHPGWLTFISVRDVDTTAQAVQSQGGKVLAAPKSYPQRGRQAVFEDPQGAVFAVLSSSSGDPPDVLAAPGQWIWSSVVSHDAGAEAAFYQTLLGYEVFALPSDDNLEHVVLATDDYARAGASTLPPAAARVHAHWINFVRVGSTAEAAEKAQALGGRVLVAPHPARHGGLVAIVADPAGASFGLMEWTDTDSEQVTP